MSAPKNPLVERVVPNALDVGLRPAPHNNHRFWLATWSAWGGVALAGLLAYANSFTAAFTLDNKLILGGDPRLQSAAWAALKAIFTRDYWWPVFPSNLYRPLTTLSYWANYTLLGNGPHPAGYHWVNLAIHLANSAWIVWLAARLARSTAVGLAAGLVFAVHPVTVEAVTNVVGRADLLATFCLLSALYCHWAERKAAFIAWTLVGLLCKENAIAIVPAVVGIDLVCFRAQFRERLRGYWTLLPALALFGTIQWTFGSSSPIRGTYFIDNPIAGATGGAGFMTACAVQAKYLGLLFWPAQLSCDYSYDQIPLFGSGDFTIDLEAWLFLATLGAIAWAAWRCRRNPLLCCGLVGYVVFQLPTANLLKVIGSIMAERFLYLPLVGFAWGIAAAAGFLAQRVNRAWLPVALGLAAAAALGARTFVRNRDWQTDLSLWRSAVAVSPHSYKTHKGLAAVLAEQDPSEAGIDRAIAEAEKALAILNRPEVNDAIVRRETTVSVDLGQYYQAKADFRRAAHDAAGQRAYLQRTIAILQRAVTVDQWVNGDSRRIQLARGARSDQVRTYGREDLYQGLAVALLESGRVADAVPNAIAAIRLNPTDPAAFEFLASCENRLRRPEAAILALYFAIFANHQFTRAQQEMATLYAQRGTAAGAVRADLLQACRAYDRLLRGEAFPQEADNFRAYAQKTYGLTPADFESRAGSPAPLAPFGG